MDQSFLLSLTLAPQQCFRCKALSFIPFLILVLEYFQCKVLSFLLFKVIFLKQFQHKVQSFLPSKVNFESDLFALKCSLWHFLPI